MPTRVLVVRRKKRCHQTGLLASVARPGARNGFMNDSSSFYRMSLITGTGNREIQEVVQSALSSARIRNQASESETPSDSSSSSSVARWSPPLRAERETRLELLVEQLVVGK